MSTWILIICLLCIFLFDLRVFKKFYHPSVLFVFFFIISIANGLLNYRDWDFKLHWVTVFVLAFGAFIFSAVCYITAKILKSKIPNTNVSKKTEADSLNVPIWVGVISLLFIVVSSFLYLNAVRDVVTSNGIEANYLSAMVEYDRLTKFTQVDTSIRGLVGQLFVAVQALSYVWMYIFLRNFFANKKKIEWLAIPNMLFSALLPMASGGRAGVITFIVAFVVMFFIFFTSKDESYRKRYFRKILVALIAVIAIGVLAFKPIVNFMGRDTGNETLLSYLSLYLGAPIKNLDMYLSNTLANPITVKTNFWGEQTFAILYESLAHWTGQDVSKQWNYWQPYQEVNGHSLGNVYTTYYPFIFDWGICGAMLAIAVIAFLMQLCFYMVENHRLMKYESIKLSTLIYCYASYGIVFSFYLNFLITTTVSSSFIRFLLVWIFCSYGLTLCNFVQNKIVAK